jgi:hypothetical protein
MALGPPSPTTETCKTRSNRRPSPSCCGLPWEPTTCFSSRSNNRRSRVYGHKMSNAVEVRLLGLPAGIGTTVCGLPLYYSQQARSFQLVTQRTLLSPSLHLLSRNQICLRLTEHDTVRRVGTSSRQSEGPPYSVHRPIQCVLQAIAINRVHAQHNASIDVSIDP